jgi:hypothetical protein
MSEGKPMNVKEGDRAEIIFTPGGKSVGTIVRVCEPEGIHSKWGPLWNVSPEGEVIETSLGHGNHALCADDWLRKLPDDQQFKQKTTTKEKVVEH